MPIIINFKICDNSPDCLGVEECPTKALYFNENKKSLDIDNTKCINCGKCVSACSVKAIHLYYKNEEERKKIEEEIKNDPRTISDLFVDRYGSEPQVKEFFCPLDKFNTQIINSTKPTIVECFDDDSIRCLIESIPIKELFNDLDIVFRKFAVEEDLFKKQYSIDTLPCLLFFKDGKLVDKIEGFYTKDQKELLKDKIEKVSKKLF